MRTKFKNPPLDELVFTSNFSPLQPLQPQHVGLFWGQLADKFPVCTQHQPYKEIVQYDNEPFPMPRFWLVTGDDSRVLQIQKNAFIGNWRRRPSAPEYPHFEVVKAFFFDHLLLFKSFLQKHLSSDMEQLTSLELTYINFMTMDGANGISGMARIIPGIDKLGIPETLGTIQGFSVAYHVEVSADLALRIAITHAKRTADGADGLRVELKAVGIPDPPDWSAASIWYDKAHQHIGDLFLSLPSRPAQESWGPIEGLQ